MEIRDKRIVLTGAAGGMGSILAAELAKQGGKLLLVDANEEVLTGLAGKIDGAVSVAGNLASAAGCREVAAKAEAELGGVDLLINLAGINSFAAFEDEDDARLELMMQVNLLAPMWLSRSLLPGMLKLPQAKIVNVGSIFGSIGFAYFTAYSASKFGLRGFSEALRRELADTTVSVAYIAPRAVKTPMNSDAVMRMGEATGMNMDAPEAVVAEIIAAIRDEKKDRYLGFPEKLFVRINSILPRIVDNSVAKQNSVARPFAKKEK